MVSAAVHETILQMFRALGFFQPLRLQNKISHSFSKKNKWQRQGWEVSADKTGSALPAGYNYPAGDFRVVMRNRFSFVYRYFHQQF